MTASAHLHDHSHGPAHLNCSDVSIATVGNCPVVLPLPDTTAATTRGDDDDDDNGEGDSSSLSTAESSSLEDITTTASSAKTKRKSEGIVKRVTWDRIQVREFDLVVGDHPMCQDGLPVSLGWHYNDDSCSTKNIKLPEDDNRTGDTKNRLSPLPRQLQQQQLPQQQLQPQIQLSERRQSYVFPRRLSYEERRERLISVSNLTLDQIKNDELDLVVRTLQESWGDEEDVIMEPVVRDDDDCYPWNDDNLMELDDIEVVPGVDIDHIDEDFGDITNFEWIDNEVRDASNQDQR